MHTTPDRRRARGLALLVGTVILAVTATVGTGSPAGAAPPPAAHATVVNPNPVDTTPHVLDGRTEAVLDLGSRVIVGGTFTRVKRYSRPDELARSYLFAYDKATGTIDPTFLPQPDGRVSALLRAADGTVIVSGQFRAIGGRAIAFAARIDPVTGAAVPGFAPRPDGMVYDMHQAGGHLYLAGTFSRVGTSVRTNFAAVDPVSGAVRAGADLGFGAAPRGVSRVMRIDVSPDGRKLVAIGNFARVGGQVRENVAVVDLNTTGGGTTSGWRTDRYRDLTCGPSWDTVTYDVDMAPDGSYFVIVTTGGPGGTTRLCDTATRWETGATGVANPTWINFSGGDSLTSVAVTGGAVYVAGHQRWMDNPQGRDSKGPGAVDRLGIAALSPTTGRTLAWNPGRERGLVAPRLVATPQGLYVLSDSAGFGGEFHPRITYLTLTGTTPTGSTPTAPGSPTVSAATATTATVTWAAAATSGAPVTGYTLVARSGSTTLSTRDAGPALSAQVTGLPSGRVVTFAVTARTAAGAGPVATSVPALPPFRTVDAFTDRQLRDLAGRAPTAAELADWRARVGGGSVTPEAAIDAVVGGATVGKLASVVRLYRAYFQRLPDADGLRFWRGEVRRGVSLDRVSQSFARSAEFRRLYGALGDGAFVDRVYRNVLGRDAEPGGRAHWVGQLGRGVSRGKVMIGFSESPEHRTATQAATDRVLVTFSMLDRMPTTAELGTAAARPALIRAVLVSAEYDARV